MPDIPGAPTADVDAPRPPEQVEMTFATLDDFVTRYIAQVVRRRLSRSVAVWCPTWWLHEEAVARLSVLWRAFEHLKLDPALGLSIWWTQHADPHLAALMDPDRGPFVLCDPRDGHSERTLDPLPITPSPPELWNHPVFNASVPVEREPEEDGHAEHGPAESTPAPPIPGMSG